MIGIIHDHEGQVSSLLIHGTRYQPEDIGRLIADAGRLRQALDLIAQGHICDAPAFARGVIEGVAVADAWEGDATPGGLTAEEQAQADRAYRRWRARLRLVAAAVAWADADIGDAHARAEGELVETIQAYRAI